jgi:NAD(P) transhydrogenase
MINLRHKCLLNVAKNKYWNNPNTALIQRFSSVDANWSAAAGNPEPSSSAPPLYPSSPHNHYDLVVIGSGPSGKNCAINAAKNKKRVAMIDKKSMMGGVCIHTGTIPSKTFREAILYLTGSRQSAFYGKGFVRRESISSQHILDRVRKVISWESDTIVDQLHRNRVQTIQGTARFIDSKLVEIVPDNNSSTNFVPTADATGNVSSLNNSINPILAESNVISADHYLIACGTRPARNSLYPFHSPLVFDADQILQSPSWDKIRHLIVIGSGVIAIEYASMFNALPGCRVTIIDEKPSILDFIDSELVQTLKHIMGRCGATFRLGEKVTSVDVSSGVNVKVGLESGKTVMGDALFYAVGRQANTDTLNLEAAGVTTGKRGLIPVNEYFQTNVPHIYAAGDIIGFPALASTAQEQGRLASQHMWAVGKTMQPLFPYGIYTIPEISVVGLSEQELTRMKIPYEIGLCKFEETAKGQMIGGQHIDGFLKLLFCPTTHKLLGCSAIGESAVEIIHIGQAIMSQGGTIEYFRDSVFNYPTFAECYRIAALDGLGRLGHYN